jgi:alpha-tubulin suppressor-like RCC1 family protein
MGNSTGFVVAGAVLAFSIGCSSGSGDPAAKSGGAVVSALAAGDAHTMALKSDGTVWTWGWNRDGQLGDGTNTDRYTPVQVGGLAGIKAICAGGDHAVALKSDGSVWTWGNNLVGQLGDGTYAYKNTPVEVSGLSGVTAIAAGGAFTMALKGDGSVWVWGDNFGGVIGDWNSYPKGNWPSPIQVQGLSGVIALAAGWEHALVLKGDGSVWSWGDNGSGQLGGGTVNTSNMRFDPQQVLTGVATIAAGGGSDHNRHSIIIKSDGSPWTFGYNAQGELGDGTTTASNTPVAVSGLTGVTGVAAGSNFTTALKGDGTVWSWGYNVSGQLGDGTANEQHTPVQVSGLGSVVALVAGGEHALVIKSDGTVWAWGGNGNGGLGDGTTTFRNVPVEVTGL